MIKNTIWNCKEVEGAKRAIERHYEKIAKSLQCCGNCENWKLPEYSSESYCKIYSHNAYMDRSHTCDKWQKILNPNED